MLMKRYEIPYKRLKELADSLPKVASGIKKVKKSMKGAFISHKKWKEIGTGDKNLYQIYTWTEHTQLYVNHYEALIKIYSKKGEEGIEEYTINMKQAHIKNSELRAYQ